MTTDLMHSDMRNSVRRVVDSSAVNVASASAFLLICLTIAASAWGQGSQKPDPIIGTWKLNPAATKVSQSMPFPPPAQRTEVYRQTESGQIALEVTTPGANGSGTTFHLAFSARGGMVTQEQAPAGQVLIETRVAPGDWRVTYLENGVQFLTMHKVVSRNGKSMRQTFTGETPQGVPFEGVLVFDRQ